MTDIHHLQCFWEGAAPMQPLSIRSAVRPCVRSFPGFGSDSSAPNKTTKFEKSDFDARYEEATRTFANNLA